jgi:hypothetical protein
MFARPAHRKRWTIFLSYSSRDKKFAEWLYQKLINANLTVWYDRYEILVGDSLVEKIAEGLDGSELLIVVISANAMRSAWVRQELEPKILQQVNHDQVAVLPIVLGRFDPAQGPPLLRGKRFLRFPHKGSEEKLHMLLNDIEQHLRRRAVAGPSSMEPA